MEIKAKFEIDSKKIKVKCIKDSIGFKKGKYYDLVVITNYDGINYYNILNDFVHDISVTHEDFVNYFKFVYCITQKDLDKAFGRNCEVVVINE